MLCEADEAIVVVGEEQLRSKTMDKALMIALDSGRLRARQALLPRGGSLRLDTTRLPLVDITDRKFIESVLYRIQVCHATDKTVAKLLMTPMRNASVEGPALRHSHHQVGWFLAIEFVADMVGVEDYSIPHVQGHNTSGYRLMHENQTSIVALMRGGEPMALGISEAFPLALFVHANCPEDIRDDHLQGRRTVVLVDSVVNSGKTVIEFVQRIRCLCAAIRIVVAAGVVQAQSISALKKALVGYGEISVVALRISDNKFAGTGTTDTGNRLFNTTHLS
jgi:uracil phosphoribosyltransferase